MLSEATILDSNHVSRYPCDGTTVSREAAVGNNVVTVRQDELVFVAHLVRRATDEVEQAVATWRDMGAVLDVAHRPEAGSGFVVALVEQRVEGFEDTRLVLFGRGLGHVGPTYF